jgi:hypothetical protein
LNKYNNRAIQAARILNEEDVQACNAIYLNNPSNQAGRRNLIRAEFAFVEAGLYSLRYMASFGDESKISKKTYAMQNILDSINEAARALGIPLELNKQDSGWDAMTKAVKIRNRITHPKTPDSLTITDADMVVFDRATAWFSDVMIELKSLIEK